MKRLAVYGSLRTSLHNDHMLEGSKFLGLEMIWGYDMFSLGSYPCIKKGNGKVLVEVYEVPDLQARHIRDMELGARYDESLVNTEFGEALIYTFNEETYGWYDRRNRVAPVESGDWRDFYQGKKTTPVKIRVQRPLMGVTDEHIHSIWNEMQDLPF